MKGQDVVMMVLLRMHGHREWNFEELSKLLAQSVSQCHASRERLRKARLLSADPAKPWHVPVDNFAEYVIHGFKYDFPPILGGTVRGIPTAQSSEIVAEEFRSKPSGSPGIVWSSPDGSAIGQSLEPVHPTQLNVCSNPGFESVYRMLVYMDLLRVGQARERAWGARKIEEEARAAPTHKG
jgi:hypothetical protein